MTIVTLQEAQANLVELVRRLAEGIEVTIVVDQHPVAKLIGIHAGRTPRPRPPVTGVPKAGLYEGRLVIPEDFDDAIEELREYMG
jgi:antitoxin (DNA-binding transcriptional repressor) of toxin-antitoxin stability system